MDATSHGDSNDTIGGRNKFIAGVIDANEQLHIHSRISPLIFEKFEKAPMEYLGARETLIHKKT